MLEGKDQIAGRVGSRGQPEQVLWPGCRLLGWGYSKVIYERTLACPTLVGNVEQHVAGGSSGRPGLQSSTTAVLLAGPVSCSHMVEIAVVHQHAWILADESSKEMLLLLLLQQS